MQITVPVDPSLSAARVSSSSSVPTSVSQFWHRFTLFSQYSEKHRGLTRSRPKLKRPVLHSVLIARFLIGKTLVSQFPQPRKEPSRDFLRILYNIVLHVKIVAHCSPLSGVQWIQFLINTPHCSSWVLPGHTHAFTLQDRNIFILLINWKTFFNNLMYWHYICGMYSGYLIIGWVYLLTGQFAILYLVSVFREDK